MRESDGVEALLHEMGKYHTTTKKDPVTLLNVIQAIDFQSILTQLENVERTPLKSPKHQHEGDQRKQA